jgi:hypothetical protein
MKFPQLSLPFFGKQKLLLAFEYGVVLRDTAAENGIELTPEMVKKAEEMILNEFPSKTPTRLSVDMLTNILAMFEPN